MLSRSIGALIGSVLRLAIAVLVPGAGPRVALSLGSEKGHSRSKVARAIIHSPRYGLGTAFLAVAFLPSIGLKVLGVAWGVVVYFGNYFARLSFLDEGLDY